MWAGTDTLSDLNTLSCVNRLPDWSDEWAGGRKTGWKGSSSGRPPFSAASCFRVADPPEGQVNATPSGGDLAVGHRSALLFTIASHGSDSLPSESGRCSSRGDGAAFPGGLRFSSRIVAEPYPGTVLEVIVD